MNKSAHAGSLSATGKGIRDSEPAQLLQGVGGLELVAKQFQDDWVSNGQVFAEVVVQATLRVGGPSEDQQA